jgi:maleylacetoacetate isomerase
MLQLHDYWRSGAAYRVRIALHLKGLAFAQISHNLVNGEQSDAAYRALNPQGLVPALEADGLVLTQSSAIIEWLDETVPTPPLLPKNPADRAIVRAMAAIIAADIHPLNNLRVLQRLDTLATEARLPWAAHWINSGFDALEVLLARHAGAHAFGDAPGLADCFIIPQAYSAARFKVALDGWPVLARVVANGQSHPAFIAAHPAQQPDAVQTA